MMAAWRFSLPLLAAVLLQACGGTGPRGGDGPPDDAALPPLPPDPVPRAEPRSRYGNPTSYVVFGRRYHTLRTSAGYRGRGVASWYGRKFHGRRTSSGEPYDMHAMTAAHRSLPLPSYVQVTNLENGRRVVVRVNDRGPFHDNRIIDLSYAAARKLDIVRSGTGLVELRALTPGDALPPPTARRVAARVRAPRPALQPPVPAAAPPEPSRSPGPAPTPVAGAAAQALPAVATPASRPRIFLQAGAFLERGNAEGLRTRLASLPGAVVAVHEGLLDGRPVYRVRLGPLDDVAAADRLASTVAEAGIDLPRIVID